jgi:hypothetical protein
MSRAAAAAAGLVLLFGSPLHAAPGDPVGTQFQVNTYETGAQSAPAVASDGAGFVVVWNSVGSGGTDTDAASIQARRYDLGGAPLGGQFQVNTYTTTAQRDAQVAPHAGGFVVVWQGSGSGGSDDDGTSVHAQRFDAAGAPVGGELQVNTYTTGAQEGAAIAADGAGGFVVVWTSDGGGSDTDGASIRGRRFDANGMAVGSEFQANTYVTGAQYDAAIGGDGAGGFVVVWTSEDSAGTDTSGTSVQGRRFDVGGNPVGEQFQVNGWTTGAQRSPVAGATGGGGFIVVWESEASGGTDTSGTSVQMQRYDAAGLPAGDQVQVNTYTTLTQDVPRVGADGAGGFLVLWESAGSSGDDDDGFSAQARRFDGSGSPVGEEFQVNTYVTSEQQPHAASPDGSGGFVIVWDSLGSATDDSLRSIQAQRYEGPGPGNGPTTTSSTTLPGASTTSTTTAAASSTTTTTITAPFGAEPLAGRALELRTKPGRPERSRLAVRSRDRRFTLGRGNESPDDPVLHGGALEISSSAGAFSARHELAGAWRYLGRVGQNRGYRWTAEGAPIRTIVIKRGKLVRIAGRGGALGFDLDDNPDAVRVTLAIGGHLYCLEFGGAAAFRPDRRFVATGAGAPGVCP